MTVWTSLFANKKPVLGQLCLPALPATPAYGGSWAVSAALLEQEALALASGGVDGLELLVSPEVQATLLPLPAEAWVVLTHTLRRLASLTQLPIGLAMAPQEAAIALTLNHLGLVQWLKLSLVSGSRLTSLGWLAAGRLPDSLQEANLPLLVSLHPDTRTPLQWQEEWQRDLHWLQAQSKQVHRFLPKAVCSVAAAYLPEEWQSLVQALVQVEGMPCSRLVIEQPATLEAAQEVYALPTCQGLFIGEACRRKALVSTFLDAGFPESSSSNSISLESASSESAHKARSVTIDPRQVEAWVQALCGRSLSL